MTIKKQTTCVNTKQIAINGKINTTNGRPTESGSVASLLEIVVIR